ncbi:MAG: SDR family NAD(P)-dependent oxidoreductase, partial [Deltaproteobacteria bacterium]
MDLQGTAALVTGGASGLGAATAQALAAGGAKVAILDINGDAAAKMAHAIGGIGLAADITSEESVAAALAHATTQLGPVRIVINCAGIGTAGRIVGRDGPMALSAFQRVISVNLIGTFNVLRLAAAQMASLDPCEDDERGVIINTASVAAFEGQIGQAAYAASKGGIVALTLPAAREFARFGVRVNVIAPGIFHTPLLDTLPEDAQKALAADIPFPARLGRPEEFADTVLFAVRNRYLNG